MGVRPKGNNNNNLYMLITEAAAAHESSKESSRFEVMVRERVREWEGDRERARNVTVPPFDFIHNLFHSCLVAAATAAAGAIVIVLVVIAAAASAASAVAVNGNMFCIWINIQWHFIWHGR